MTFLNHVLVRLTPRERARGALFLIALNASGLLVAEQPQPSLLNSAPLPTTKKSVQASHEILRHSMELMQPATVTDSSVATKMRSRPSRPRMDFYVGIFLIVGAAAVVAMVRSWGTRPTELQEGPREAQRDLAAADARIECESTSGGEHAQEADPSGSSHEEVEQLHSCVGNDCYMKELNMRSTIGAHESAESTWRPRSGACI